MFYGLATELVPETRSDGALSATARAIIDATTLLDFRCRIGGAASQIAAEQPDVIGLQEALRLSYERELNDPGSEDVLIDFIAELQQAIVKAGGPHYVAFERENAIVQSTLPVVGGIRLGDRSAILVNSRYSSKLITSRTFQTLEPASELVPGTNGMVVRGALHVRVSFSDGTVELFNTHLQSDGSPDVRAAQATELAALIQSSSAPGSIIILTGDLNDVPNSPAWTTLSAELTDTYAVVGVPPGFTAYQPQTLNNPTDQSNMRIDFIFVRAPMVEESRVIFNAQVEPCNLWPSDHFGVVSRISTGAGPASTPP
jgi:endonuclease/exonuclease/phosphatase family metal-dependent hydrolase